MRRRSLTLMTLLAMSVAVPAAAQVFGGVVPGSPAPRSTARQESHATPDAMVARLMSFDRNHDGLLARNELPERMQGLFARADVIKKDNQLDAAEVRSLAERPAPQAPLRGFQPGQYGFGDTLDLDSRLHIDGAVDDLRLAAATRDKVFGIIREFQSATQAKAASDLVAGMSTILTSAQLADFKDVMSNEPVRSVPALELNGVTVFGATPEELAAGKRVMTPLRLTSGVNLSRQIEQYGLALAQRKAALAALDEYELRRAGRFSDRDRTALLAQLKGVLDDQQRDDLRAALERRPIVKQGEAARLASLQFQSQVAPPTFRQGTTFAIQDLVLREAK